MKIRLLLSFAGLIFGFALPSFAQQTDTPNPQVRDAFVALAKRFDDAYISGNAAALTALYTEDAVLVNDSGPLYDREAIQKAYEEMFKAVRFISHVSMLDWGSPHMIGTSGNEMWATGKWTQTIKGQNFGPLDETGYWTNIFTREGDTWKVRVSTWNRSKVY